MKISKLALLFSGLAFLVSLGLPKSSYALNDNDLLSAIPEGAYFKMSRKPEYGKTRDYYYAHFSNFNGAVCTLYDSLSKDSLDHFGAVPIKKFVLEKMKDWNGKDYQAFLSGPKLPFLSCNSETAYLENGAMHFKYGDAPVTVGQMKSALKGWMELVLPQKSDLPKVEQDQKFADRLEKLEEAQTRTACELLRLRMENAIQNKRIDNLESEFGGKEIFEYLSQLRKDQSLKARNKLVFFQTVRDAYMGIENVLATIGCKFSPVPPNSFSKTLEQGLFVFSLLPGGRLVLTLGKVAVVEVEKARQRKILLYLNSYNNTLAHKAAYHLTQKYSSQLEVIDVDSGPKIVEQALKSVGLMFKAMMGPLVRRNKKDEGIPLHQWIERGPQEDGPLDEEFFVHLLVETTGNRFKAQTKVLKSESWAQE